MKYSDREGSMIAEKFFKTSSHVLIGSGCAATAFAEITDVYSWLCFAAVFIISWFSDTAKLRRRLASWVFAVLAFGYLCFIPVDYALLSHAWPPVLLHLIWFLLAMKLLTRTGDRDWPVLYLLAAFQWLPVALQPIGMAFWSCLALFVISGVTALMLYEVRRPLGRVHPNMKPSRKFTFNIFSLSATGITSAVLIGAIPIFLFFPRLSANGTQPATATPSSVSATAAMIELGHNDSVAQSNAVVMRVKTDMPRKRLPYNLKWRGLAFDYYDGRTWTLRHRQVQAVAMQGRFYKLEESAMDADLLRQTFFMEELAANTIFAAHRTLAISQDAGLVQQDTAGNLLAWRSTPGGTSYVAVSDLIQPAEEKISDWVIVPHEIHDAYLQLPPLDPRITELTRAITQEQNSRYAKARALENWLRTQHAYSRTFPEIPASGDPLTSFLFDVKAGSCDYFATALTIMLRQIGIPTRMTSGFLAGEYNPVSGSWTVRQHHAHVWIEAWFPPYGWVEFDPTPAQPETTSTRFLSNLVDAVAFWWRENVVDYDASRQYSIVSGFFAHVNLLEDHAGEFLSTMGTSATKTWQSFSRIPLLGIISTVAPVLIVTLVILIVRPLRRRLSSSIRRRLNRSQPGIAATGFYTQALSLLKKQGFVRQTTQTPVEFVQSLGNHPAAATLSDLTRLYNNVRFGQSETPFPHDEAQRLMRSLRASLKIN